MASAARSDRTFAVGRGGLGIDPRKTAMLCIEFQNEFCSEGGKLHGAVRDVMRSTGMLDKASRLSAELRRLGVKVFHAPISFAPDGSDNPNKHLGILAGCESDRLFTRGTWNAQICEAMAPQPGDVEVVGKRGLSAFPNTNLEEQLKQHGVETIALAGFMANCCVESTMRDACEKGFNVVTLTDCVATTSAAGYKAAVEITYPFFSTPLNAFSFLANVKGSVALARCPIAAADPPPAKRLKAAQTPHQTRAWSFSSIATDVFQAGPWFADVRQSAIGEKLVLRSGAHELQRYLTFAEAAGCLVCDCMYARKMPAEGEATEPFGWLCNMVVIRMPEGGCLVYSPVLGEDGGMDSIVAALEHHKLLPVRWVIAPSPQHHLALQPWQTAFPEANYVCGKASGQMPPLTRKRRELRFDGVLSGGAEGAVLGAPVCDREGAEPALDSGRHWAEVTAVCDVLVLDDNRTGEIVLRHRPTSTLILSDLLYKSTPDVHGPGGKQNAYTKPEWFATGQEELFCACTLIDPGLLAACLTSMDRAQTPGRRTTRAGCCPRIAPTLGCDRSTSWACGGRWTRCSAGGSSGRCAATWIRSKGKRRGPSSSGRGRGVGTECCSKVEWIDKFQSN